MKKIYLRSPVLDAGGKTGGPRGKPTEASLDWKPNAHKCRDRKSNPGLIVYQHMEGTLLEDEPSYRMVKKEVSCQLPWQGEPGRQPRPHPGGPYKARAFVKFWPQTRVKYHMEHVWLKNIFKNMLQEHVWLTIPREHVSLTCYYSMYLSQTCFGSMYD